MELEEKQLSRLKQLLTLLEPDVLTKEDFKTNFKAVVDFVKKIEVKNIEEFKVIHKAVNDLTSKLSDDNYRGIETLKNEATRALNARMDALTAKQDGFLKKAQERINQIKDGEDADEEKIIEAVVSQIKIPDIKELEDNLPKLGERIRDGLELLEGDERLDITAIKGLEDIKTEGKNVRIVAPSRGMYIYVDGVKKGLINTLNLIPGTNVTFNYTTTNGRNDLTISASGAALAILAATGAVDNSNTAFTFISEPSLVIVNGATYRDGHGCSISGTDVTLDNPVGLNGDIYGLG